MKAWIPALFLVISAAAHAQQQNPNNFHGAHHPDSSGYVGPRNQPQQAAPQPTGWWEKTWGAIAPSPEGGVLGTAVGAKSKHEAERLALADCASKGGGACKVQVSYYNQCGVMVLGQERLFTARAGSEAEAAEEGLKYCLDSGDSNCRIYYSACTEPLFHPY